MKIFDLGWGESVAVRKAFVEESGNFFIPFNNQDIIEMGYTPHEGDPAMIEATRDIVERQTGIRYNHIVLTHGATGALNVALTALERIGFDEIYTLPAPFFRMYPDIIRNSGIYRSSQVEDFSDQVPGIVLIDSPSNPLGIIHTGDLRPTSNGFISPTLDYKHVVVWDSVYHTGSYLPRNVRTPPDHDINIGSYSKMTGINGIRIGWVATNNGIFYERIKQVAAANYCGLSAAQNRIALDLVTHVDWDLFEMKARNKLDANREEWSKLEKYFGDKAVYPVGMFYWAPMDQSCKDLMNRSGVTYFPGSKLYSTDDFGRINLGQDTCLIRDAVKNIIKEDTIK